MNNDANVEHQYWLIAAPPDPDSRESVLDKQKAATSQLASSFGFDIPTQALRVGTLDALMALSDDLVKIDLFVESTTNKIARQFLELTELSAKAAAGREDGQLKVNGKTVDGYLQTFKWDETKYPTKNSLRETVEQASQEVSKLDEELRTKSQEHNQLQQQLAAEDRKRAGNMLVRSLNDIVAPTDAVETEYLTTLFVVVPKYHIKEWMACYEKLNEFVLPASSKIVTEDSEHALVTVTIFKRMVDDFKNKAREHRFIVRDYQYDPESKKKSEEERRLLESTLAETRRKLFLWAKVNFSEAFVALIHIKAIRLFVESVLRFGLPVNISAVLTKPGKGQGTKLRQALAQLYRRLDSQNASGADEGNDDFFAYAFTRVNVNFGSAF